jgi:hypothetical protein
VLARSTPILLGKEELQAHGKSEETIMVFFRCTSCVRFGDLVIVIVTVTGWCSFRH